MFSPLAYTLGFALLGALAFTLTLVPVLSSMLLNKNVREKKNRFLDFIARHVMSLFRKCHAHAKTTLAFAAIVILVGLGAFPRLGTEFLPQLNEGAIYIRRLCHRAFHSKSRCGLLPKSGANYWPIPKCAR